MFGMFQHRIVVSAPALKQTDPRESRARQSTGPLQHQVKGYHVTNDSDHTKDARVPPEAVHRLHVVRLPPPPGEGLVQVPQLQGVVLGASEKGSIAEEKAHGPDPVEVAAEGELGLPGPSVGLFISTYLRMKKTVGTNR